MSKRICPTENIGWNYMTGQHYHKLWGGCGWIGDKAKCDTETKWAVVGCPVCGSVTEDYDAHKEKMQGKPSGWVETVEIGGFIPYPGVLKSLPPFICPHCGKTI